MKRFHLLYRLFSQGTSALIWGNSL